MLQVIKIAYKSANKNFSDYKLFILNNVIAFVSTFLFWGLFLYSFKLFENGLLSFNFMRLLGGICGAFSVVSIAIILYALKKFTITRANEYSILIDLGIRRKHFNLFLLIEYGCVLSISLISGLVLGNFTTKIIFFVFNTKNSFIEHVSINMHFINLIVLVSYVIIIVVALIIVIYFQHRNGIGKYFEALGQYSRTTKNSNITIAGFIIGIFLFLYSINLLTLFSIEKLFLSMGINIIGFLFILYNIEILKPLFKKCFPKQYFYNLIKWNHIFLKLEQNKNIVWSIYIINFIGTFIFAGLLTSLIVDNTNYDELYPYDIVYVSETSQNNIFYNFNKGNQVLEIPFLKGVYKERELICIDIESYNKITSGNNYLEKGEIFFYGQRRLEDFNVLDQETVSLEINNHEKLYKCVDSKWKIIFGEKLSDKMENVVVMNKDDYEYERNNRLILGLVIYNNSIDLEAERKMLQNLDENTVKYSKKTIILSNQLINEFSIIIIIIIGLFILWICCCILYIKNYLDLEQSYDMKNTYEILGIRPKKLKNIFKCELSYTYLAVVEVGLLMSTVYFMADCFYETTQVFVPLIIFGLTIMSYNICQILIYNVFVKNIIKKLDMEE